MAVWLVLVVGLVIVADFGFVRTGHGWTAVIVSLLACVFLAFVVANSRSAGAASAKGAEKPKQA
jgi:hypothetical protein